MAITKEYNLKIDTATAQANVDELNESFELQKDLVGDIEKELRDYEKQLRNTSEKNLSARKRLNDKIEQTKKRLADERDGLKDVTIERDKANKTMKKAEENAADYGGVLGTLDSKTGGLISGFKGMTKSISSATKGMKLMRIAVIGTGIGALLIAITSLASAFKSSEEGQNKWNKIMAIIGATVSVFTDRLAELGEGLINLFTSPIETLKGFGKSIKEFVMDKVDQTVSSLGLMGSAISKLFKGDFSGALEDAKNGIVGLNRALNPVVMITDALIDSTKDLITEITKEGKIAGQIADQRAKADKLDRQLTVDRAKADRDRATLLEKSVDKEKYNIEQRIAFLKQAGKLEEEITAKEITAAQLRLDAKQKENALGKSTKEDLEEEANLKAELIKLETAKIQKQREVTGQIIALKAEEKAKQDALDAEAKAKKDEADAKEIEDAKALADLKRQIRDEEAITEDERRLLEIEKTTEHYDNLIALAKAQGLSTVGLERAKTDKLDKIAQDSADKKARLEKLRKQQTLNDAKNTLNQVSQLAGKDSKIGKAMAIASATISGVQGVQNAYSTAQKSPITAVFPAYPVVQAGLAGAVALKNIAAIKSVDSTGKGSVPTPPSGGSGGGGSAPPTPPAFNVVGSSNTNQLADAIGGQSQQPTRAYVVSGDVTTAQEMERNTIGSASI